MARIVRKEVIREQGLVSDYEADELTAELKFCTPTGTSNKSIQKTKKTSYNQE